LDENYSKCYYRLAQEYKEIPGSEYSVFINAVRFMRVAGEKQAEEREDMRKFVKYYKEKLNGGRKDVKYKNIDEIVGETEKLIDAREVRDEVDKEISEWVSEWESNTQSEEAKLLEIEYIMEEIDY
jgi:gas vesicle protein